MEIVYLIFSGISFYVGYTFGKKDKPTAISIDEETKRKKEKLARDFNELMSYNENIAIGGKQDGE